MSPKLDSSSRRILTFPAVQPSDTVLPATLLSSLINLSTEICSFRTKPFSSNRKNSRESIRLVELLLVFFEEIRDRNLYVSAKNCVSLSKLHYSLQKIRFLLKDCGDRDGARLWMLMKSERVSSHFRGFVRSIGVALDGLSFDSINISIEVMEMVELATRQTRNRKSFECELDDLLSLNKVHCALNMFEKMSAPKIDDLRYVFEHIKVGKWSECNQEVKFLNSEMKIELSESADKSTTMFLSSLIGFMSYSRCVVFESIDAYTSSTSPAKHHSNNLSFGAVVNCLNVENFRCPISLEIMVDPVTISTGHTYDRSSIEKWLHSENPICPTTGEKLKNKEFVPNLALRKLTRQYCHVNNITMSEIESSGRTTHSPVKTVLENSAAYESAMQMAAKFLCERLDIGTNEQRNKAAYEIRILSKTSVFNRSCFADAGTIPHLLNLLSSTDAITQENAIAALLNISKYKNSKIIMVQKGGIHLILNILKMGIRMEAKQHAAAVLFYLSSIQEYRVLIGENPETIPSLIELITNGSSRAKKNALATICGLLIHQDHHWRVLASGAVPVLLNLLKSSETEDLKTDCLAILSSLAENPDGTISILRRGGLQLALEILVSSDSRSEKEFCVSLLLALCVNGGGDVVSVLVKDQSLIGALYGLLTEGTSRGSKKASSVIKILHEFNERNSSGFKNINTTRERFVHVR